MAFVKKSRCTISKYFFCFIEAKTISHDSHQSCHFPTKSFLMISRAFLKVIQGIPCFPQPSNVCFLSSTSLCSPFQVSFSYLSPPHPYYSPLPQSFSLILQSPLIHGEYEYSNIPSVCLKLQVVPNPVWTMFFIFFLCVANGQVLYIVLIRWTNG